MSLGGLAVIVVGLALVPVVAIDLEHLLIPDIVILPAAALAVLFGALAQPSEWWTPDRLGSSCRWGTRLDVDDLPVGYRSR